MTSRGIANMHLFFEMKNKFPELPEDIIRKHVHQCSEDQEKCLQHLKKECEIHGYSKNPFAEFPVSCHSTGSNTGSTGIANTTNGCDSKLVSQSSIPSEQVRLQRVQPLLHFPQELSSVQKTSFVSSKCILNRVEILQPSNSLKNRNISLSKDIDSVLNTSGDKKTFSDYGNSPSIHSPNIQYSNLQYVTTPKYVDKEKLLFSKPEEQHKLPSSTVNVSNEVFSLSPKKCHMVKLSITPVFPYHQQCQSYNLCGNSSDVCSSGIRKHTTSVNMQLRLPSSDNFPVSVIASPTNIRSTKARGDFDSHLHISICSNSASFTARRLQKSPNSQSNVLQPNISSVHHTPFSKPKRPNILNLYLPSHDHARSKASLSPERKPSEKKFRSLGKLCAGQVRSSALSKIPETQEISKSNWLHYLPSPYQNEELFKYSLSLPWQKHDTSEKDAQHYASSLDEKQSYINAILAYQKAKLEMLQAEIKNVKKIHAQLQIEIDVMEKEISGKQTQQVKIIHFEEVQKLKEENKKLRMECDCLLTEVNVYNTNQAASQANSQSFYDNIFTGPVGPIPSIPKDNKDFISGTSCHKIKDFNMEDPLLSEDKLVTGPRRTVGSVQISVTQNRSSSKGIKLQLTHRVHRS